MVTALKKPQLSVARRGDDGFACARPALAQLMSSDSSQPPRRRSASAGPQRRGAALPSPPAARRGYRRALVLLGLFASLALGRLLWREVFVNQERFALREIVVRTHGPLSPAALVEASALSEGMNLLTVNLGEVAQRLETLPAVRQAEVVRDFSGRLTLRVEQREALAVLAGPPSAEGSPGASPLLIDATAVPFSAPSGLSLKALPWIRAASLPTQPAPGRPLPVPGLDAALRWIELCQRLHRDQALPALRELRLPKPWRLELQLEDGTLLLAAVQDFEAQRQRLERIWAEARQRHWKMESLDLASIRPPVRFAQPPQRPNP